VIVCYGYFEAEHIANEVDFLFNRNRLNVALTRAKSKAIFVCYLFLPERWALLTSACHRWPRTWCSHLLFRI
jgi:superfamily I DNA and/or RNA helicase